MSDPETLPAGVHPEVELLPWYATDTLGEDERQQVARHLESCQDCSRELEDFTHIRQTLTELSREEAEPSARVYRSVMARVAADVIRQDPTNAQTSWAAGMDRWLRSLLTPQWVPTLAAIMLAAQMGLLIWVTLPPEKQSQISSRSVDIPTQAARIAVTFQPSATEAGIRSLLERIHARVVDGPTAEGRFTISVGTGNPAAALAQLREQRDVIRSADPVQP
jgi:anti-sigma factor RsiW